MNTTSYNAIDIDEIIEKIGAKYEGTSDFFESVFSNNNNIDLKHAAYILVYYDELLTMIDDFIDEDEEDCLENDEAILAELKTLNIALDELIAIHD